MPMEIHKEFILGEVEKIEGKSPRFISAIEFAAGGGEISSVLVNEIARHFLRDACARASLHPLSLGSICRMITQCRHLDWLLYLTQKRYRDHSQHQFYTSVLGWTLLNTQLTYNGRSLVLKQYMTEETDVNIDDVRLIEKAWWIASLLHDHAYPLAHLFRTMPAIGSNSVSDQMLPALFELYHGLYNEQNILKVLTALKTSHDVEVSRRGLHKYLSCFFNSREFEMLIGDEENLCDHGLWSAANLVAQIVEEGNPVFNFRRNGSLCFANDNRYEREQKCIKQVIRAIAIHNCKSYKPVSIRKDPVGFLLLLCDEMQEWDRLTMVGSRAGIEADYIELKGIEGPQDARVFSDSIGIEFCYKAETLEDTKWDYQEFFKSKRNALERLKVPADFPITKVDFRISTVPHIVNLVAR